MCVTGRGWGTVSGQALWQEPTWQVERTKDLSVQGRLVKEMDEREVALDRIQWERKLLNKHLV